MRLLNARTLVFEDLFDAAVPKYAILSHTWGKGEVSLQDFQRDDRDSLEGFSKIQQTCR